MNAIVIVAGLLAMLIVIVDGLTGPRLGWSVRAPLGLLVALCFLTLAGVIL
jgi:hypothetical protein